MTAVLMRTIKDFPAYGMVFGCSMYEKLVCPYCMENKKAFTLENDVKTSFFIVTDGSYQRITSEELYDMVS
jgi:hypothetical protein